MLLASEGYSATKIARVIYCSRTTVYTTIGRSFHPGRATSFRRSQKARSHAVGGKLDTQRS